MHCSKTLRFLSHPCRMVWLATVARALLAIQEHSVRRTSTTALVSLVKMEEDARYG